MNCGPRDYYLYGSHPSLTLNSATRTLSLQTAESSHVGSHDVSVLVWLRDFPQFNYVVQLIAGFKIDIDAACHYTTFSFAPNAFLHTYSTGPSAYTLANVIDTESSIGAPADGETYCKTRTFTFQGLTSTEHASPASIVSFDSL